MYIRKSLLGGFIAAAGMTVLAILMVLFCFTEIQIPTIGMDRLPLRDADRSFQDIRVKAAARARSEAGSHKDEKSVSFGCHSRSE